jgi:hypothetical protein
MLALRRMLASSRAERGVVLIVVLIVATIFALLAYAALAVSIKSLESTDTYRNMYVTRQVAEGAVHEGAYRLLNNPDVGDLPTYLDPLGGAFSLSTSETSLKANLINDDFSTPVELDTFPSTIERMAYTTDSQSSVYAPDTDLIPGDRDNALYSFYNDDTFSQDYPGYEFAQVQQQGNLTVYGVGQLAETDGNTTLFSFVRGDYPNLQWNYDMRTAGVTEPSRMGPYPYIETEHPYNTNESRGWVVTYLNDPAHRGRTITTLRLKAALNEVQIDAGDELYISAWQESEKRFQNQLEAYSLATPYVNTIDEIFTPPLNTEAIALYFRSDSIPPAAGTDFGFRVSGVRYDFDSDYFPAYYESPHPYDSIVLQTDESNLNLQVIYSPYQSNIPGLAASQQMSIAFDSKFSLDGSDRLYLYNISDTSATGPIVSYTNASPPPVSGSPVINRINTDQPLGIALVLLRNGSADSDGEANYGYKVSMLSYTDPNVDWIESPNPVMQSPHNFNLGNNTDLLDLPGLPFVLPVDVNAGGFQTIYKPAVPNVDSSTGQGTVDNWFVRFAATADLTASSGAANQDFIQVTTPGFPQVAVGVNLYDYMIFVHPASDLGQLYLEPSPMADARYFDIALLKDLVLDCGTADVAEINFVSDTADAYENSLVNYGFQVAEIGYTTQDGADDDNTPPTIRTDVNFPLNETYPSYGDGPLESPEWWYSNPTALVVGLHFDRTNFNLEPGDRIEVFDEIGTLIATLVPESVAGGPDAGGPVNPDQPGGGQQPGHGPGAQGPYVPDGTVQGTIVDLNATYGWVVVPGTTARVVLVGDADDNQGFSGFEIDHCGFVNGDLTEIHDYATEYADVAYGKYYDRTAEPLQRFRSLGVE